jgi:hypothetical protein
VSVFAPSFAKASFGSFIDGYEEVELALLVAELSEHPVRAASPRPSPDGY